MRVYDLILKKRDGLSLSQDEISYLVNGFAKGLVPDYQVAAFLMAVFFRGLSAPELAHFTNAMVASGETIDLSFIPGRKVDKHSSGGVGDKTSLVVCPIVASCGVPVAKVSGRGLGHTGGTLDKLESIPGMRVSLSPEEFREAVVKSGIAIVGQTARLVPADALLYALRDVIATVDSIPLIASSIMSKKIAGGADAIVLDVKVGSGAFMKGDLDALELARTMVCIGTQVGRETIALVSDMSQPLGLSVGNALEIKEVLATLRGHGPKDFVELCISIATEMVAVGLNIDITSARQACEASLSNGRALEKFRDMVISQGGEPAVIDNPELLPQAAVKYDVLSTLRGVVTAVDALSIGRAALALGAGRAKKGDVIDHSVGVVIHKKVGESIDLGEPAFTVHAQSSKSAASAGESLKTSLTISDVNLGIGPIIRHRVSASGTVSFV